MRIDQCENFASIEDVINDLTINKSSKSDYTLNTAEPYQQLMQKENKVLELMDDIHKYKVDSQTNYQFLTTSPLHVIIYRLYQTINRIAQELSQVTDVYDIIRVIIKKERLVYTGIVIVLMSVFMLLLISL
jgi:hypothetical protein